MPASPQPVTDAVFSFAVTRVLATAVELDIFTQIARGRDTCDALHRETGCSIRGLLMVLDALTALNFLEKSAGSYRLAPVSAEYLVKTSPRYIGGYVLLTTDRSWPAWAQLSAAVRSGMPYRQVQGEQPDAAFFSELVPALHILNADAAATAAKVLGEGDPARARTVLDVAAGSAVWSLAIARQDPHALVTVLDLPEVVDRVTRPFVEREGCSNRFTFLAGNLHTTDFGEGLFDIVILGHICHGEGAEGSQELIRRAHRALRPGGQILIAEFLPDDDRSGPLPPLLFALHMLVMTDAGNAFTLAEYCAWLSEAGFIGVRTLAVPAPSPLILAAKPQLR